MWTFRPSIHPSSVIVGGVLVELTGFSQPVGVGSAAQAGTYLWQKSSNMNEPLCDSRLFSRFLMHAAEVKRCATEVNIGAGRPATNDLFFCEKMINVFKMWEKKKWKESKVRSSKYLFIAWLTVRNPKILTWSLMSFLCSEDFLTFAIFFSIFTSLCIE